MLADGRRFLAGDWLLVLFGSATLLFEVSFLAIVIASDVGLVLPGWALLCGVNVYGAGVCAVRGAVVVTFFLVVGLVGLGCSTLVFALLLARVLPIVDSDCYGDVVVETVGSIDLV